MRLRWLAAAALMASAAAGPASAGTSISAFAGLLTDNPWEEVALRPWRIDVQRPGLAGLVLGQQLGAPVATRLGTLRFGVEAQLVRHAGLQDNWEVSLPLTARLTPRRPLLRAIDSVAGGIGLSRATRPPAFERQRGGGDAQRIKVHWHIELAHELRDAPATELFVRLHHRSNAYGLMGPGGSSNGLVAGLRHSF